MTNIEFEAIGTHWFIEIYDELDPNDLEDLKTKVVEYCSEFENKYSRFKEHSIVSKLNREKLLHKPSKEFIEILNLGKDAKTISDGHFDITVATVLENLGYDSNYSFESKNNIVEKNLNFDKDKVILSENTKIDLGGIGKGYLVDRVADVIRTEGVKHFFINAGGDIFATSNFEDSIEFTLENPFALDEMIGTIEIQNRSLASSSGKRRKWKDQKTGKESNHLVDMRNEENVSEVAGVYIEGATATNADIASTCLFISPRELYDNIAKFYGIEYLVVMEDKSFIKSDKYNGKLVKS
ncbi:MAG: FAD:protein FMN transferase [Candidatus Dojkabacteria bacterium]